MKWVIAFLSVFLLTVAATNAQSVVTSEPTIAIESSPIPTQFVADLPVLQPITADNIDRVVKLMSLECEFPHYRPSSTNAREDLIWSPTRNILAVVMSGNTCLFDMDTPGSKPVEISLYVYKTVFAPDGETLLNTISGTAENVYLWDVTTGDEKATSLYTRDDITYSPDGKYIATQSYSDGLHIFDATTEALLIHVKLGRESIVRFSGDSKRLVTVGLKGIGLWTLYPGPLLYRDKTLQFSDPDLQHVPQIGLGGKDGTLLYYPSGDEMIVYDLVQDEETDKVSPSREHSWLLLPEGTLLPMYEIGKGWVSPVFEKVFKLVLSVDRTLIATFPAGAGETVDIWGVPE